MARIRALSAEVVSRLRSDVTATTFAQCVEELLMNSLDAGATKIDVQVEAPTGPLLPVLCSATLIWYPPILGSAAGFSRLCRTMAVASLNYLRNLIAL